MEIVVTLELRRGQMPTPEWLCYPYAWGLGRANAAAITVMTLDQWNQANLVSMVGSIVDGASEPGERPTQSSFAAQILHSTLQQSGRQGALTLFSIIQGLDRQQRRVLRDMVTSWRAGEALTPRQETFLHWLAIHLRNEMRHVKEG
jgi:hypothetical protein